MNFEREPSPVVVKMFDFICLLFYKFIDAFCINYLLMYVYQAGSGCWQAHCAKTTPDMFLGQNSCHDCLPVRENFGAWTFAPSPHMPLFIICYLVGTSSCKMH